MFIAHVGDIKNYSKANQLTKLAGIDLEYEQSGKYQGKAIISKKGSSLFRYSVCSAAEYAMRNKIIKEYIQNKLKNKGDIKKAKAKMKIKIADKLLRAAFFVLKSRRPFDVRKFVNPVCN